MLLGYAALEVAVISLSVLAFVKFLKNFDVPRNAYDLLLLPFLIFPAGFFLRLAGEKGLVDAGFFFTESSFLLVYSIFASSFVLGQIRYWGKRRFIKVVH